MSKKSLGAKTYAYPTPVWIVGTYDGEGKPNVMAAAWAGICCSKPPSISISLRKATYSHANIIARKAFTINIPSEANIKESDYFGIVSGRDTDKFSATGLTPISSELVDAPYIAEFPMILECRLSLTCEIGLHTQFIGEIVDIKVEETILGEDGKPSIEKLLPCIFAPGNLSYYGIGRQLGKAYSIGKI